MTDEKPISPQQEEADAIARLGLTADGRTLHRYLRRVLEGVIPAFDNGALLEHNGRRTLARDLMRLMADTVEAPSAGSSAEQSILTRARGPSGPGSSRRGANRRVTVEPGDGWKPDDSA